MWTPLDWRSRLKVFSKTGSRPNRIYTAITNARDVGLMMGEGERWEESLQASRVVKLSR